MTTISNANDLPAARPATEPRTEAGRRLVEDEPRVVTGEHSMLNRVLAIEAEAAQGAAPRAEGLDEMHVPTCAACGHPPRPSLVTVENALDEAWLGSHDARSIARPPDLAEHLHEALLDYIAIEESEAMDDAVALMLRALQTIKRDEGKVCDQYESCMHLACSSSYSAWAIADSTLRARAVARLSRPSDERVPESEPK